MHGASLSALLLRLFAVSVVIAGGVIALVRLRYRAARVLAVPARTNVPGGSEEDAAFDALLASVNAPCAPAADPDATLASAIETVERRWFDVEAMAVATKMIAAVLVARPGDPRAYVAAANAAMEACGEDAAGYHHARLKRAEMLADRALRAAPQDPDAIATKALYRVRQGFADDAETLVANAAATHWRAAQAMSLVHAARNVHDQAVRWAELALAQAPRSAKARLGVELGDRLRNTGRERWASARIAYEHALREDERAAPAWGRLAVIAEVEGKLEEALEYCDRSLALHLSRATLERSVAIRSRLDATRGPQ